MAQVPHTTRVSDVNSGMVNCKRVQRDDKKNTLKGPCQLFLEIFRKVIWSSLFTHYSSAEKLLKVSLATNGEDGSGFQLENVRPTFSCSTVVTCKNC